ncbi:tRNA (adenosine(37)-N6)-dimethylallyltransferase MiaA [Athalassotoga saccharophila]|uniref:tRNA (adenosine(37)-N6)-dimethylallyltransferase MiaA n=1 Tax=Athalassotoga saccharophila TaxID=1441386 RepID=UPI0018D82E60|nr:tRNA (adenosine(37)-N6)-dimethylallyltransferase MiaA [Athalassotoga saccharophila]BBJ27917.1 tRNA dimethylallyltransferase [Athalassotoga saccharophila]
MKIPVIMGPTGVGKSEFAIELARKIGGEIISMDSMQIYRYMDIGTSKVDPKLREEIPHYMIDIMTPDEEFDVKRFRDMALKFIEDIISRKKVPILVGGTGLYFEVLRYGIFDGPSKNERIREALLKIEKERSGSLRNLLFHVDPKAFEKIDSHDLVRTVRALEVYILTGRPISTLWNERTGEDRYVIFILTRDRNELYSRINKRVDLMFEKGLVDEVKSLMDMGYSKDLKPMRSIGYKEVVQYLEGKIDLKGCVEMVKISTRHYAKRQLTWFRKYKDAIWIDLDEKSSLEKVIQFIE